MIDETEESSIPNPETLLGVMLEDAGDLMNQAAGGAAACSFTKAGISVPSLEYAEGRWAALRELR